VVFKGKTGVGKERMVWAHCPDRDPLLCGSSPPSFPHYLFYRKNLDDFLP
jgi:hypothetical protein